MNKELLKKAEELLPKEKDIVVQADGEYHFIENAKVYGNNMLIGLTLRSSEIIGNIYENKGLLGN